MSADTSDPALAAAVQAVHAQDDSTKWLVAAYASPTSTAIVLVDSGPDPGLPAIRARLDAPAKENGAAFAYAEVAGHGLVVLRIGDGVGGVRRAKAVLHSRTFAALFPDYLALATLTRAGEFTDAFVAERLGLTPDEISNATATGSTADEVERKDKGKGKAKAEDEPLAETAPPRKASLPLPQVPVPVPAPVPAQAPAQAQAPSPAPAPVQLPARSPSPPARPTTPPRAPALLSPEQATTPTLNGSTSTSSPTVPSPISQATAALTGATGRRTATPESARTKALDPALSTGAPPRTRSPDMRPGRIPPSEPRGGKSTGADGRSPTLSPAHVPGALPIPQSSRGRTSPAPGSRSGAKPVTEPDLRVNRATFGAGAGSVGSPSRYSGAAAAYAAAFAAGAASRFTPESSSSSPASTATAQPYGPSYGRTFSGHELPDLPTPEVSDAESEGLAPVTARVFQRSPKPEKQRAEQAAVGPTSPATPGATTAEQITSLSPAGAQEATRDVLPETVQPAVAPAPAPAAPPAPAPLPAVPAPASPAASPPAHTGHGPLPQIPVAQKPVSPRPSAPQPLPATPSTPSRSATVPSPTHTPRTPSQDAPPIPKRAAARMSMTPPAKRLSLSAASAASQQHQQQQQSPQMMPPPPPPTYSPSVPASVHSTPPMSSTASFSHYTSGFGIASPQLSVHNEAQMPPHPQPRDPRTQPNRSQSQGTQPSTSPGQSPRISPRPSPRKRSVQLPTESIPPLPAVPHIQQPLVPPMPPPPVVPQMPPMPPAGSSGYPQHLHAHPGPQQILSQPMVASPIAKPERNWMGFRKGSVDKPKGPVPQPTPQTSAPLPMYTGQPVHRQKSREGDQLHRPKSRDDEPPTFKSKSREHARALAAAAAAAAAESTERARAATRSRTSSQTSSRSRRSDTQGPQYTHSRHPQGPAPMPDARSPPSQLHAPQAPYHERRPSYDSSVRPRDPRDLRDARRQGAPMTMYSTGGGIGLGLGPIGTGQDRSVSAPTPARSSLPVPGQMLSQVPPRSSSREAMRGDSSRGASPQPGSNRSSARTLPTPGQHLHRPSGASFLSTSDSVRPDSMDSQRVSFVTANDWRESYATAHSLPTPLRPDEYGHHRTGSNLSSSSATEARQQPLRSPSLPPPTASMSALRRTNPERVPRPMPTIPTASPQESPSTQVPDSPLPPMPSRSRNRLSGSGPRGPLPPPSPAPDVPLPPLPLPSPDDDRRGSRGAYRGREHHIVQPGHGSGHHREPTEYDIDKILADVQGRQTTFSPSLDSVPDDIMEPPAAPLEPLPPLPQAAMPVQVTSSPLIQQLPQPKPPLPPLPPPPAVPLPTPGATLKPPARVDIPEDATRNLATTAQNFVSPIKSTPPAVPAPTERAAPASPTSPTSPRSARKPVPPLLSATPPRASSLRGASIDLPRESTDSRGSDESRVSTDVRAGHGSRPSLDTSLLEVPARSVYPHVNNADDFLLSPLSPEASPTLSGSGLPHSTSTLNVPSTPSTPLFEKYEHSPLSMTGSPLSPDALDLNELMGAVTGAVAMSVGRPAAARVVTLSSLNGSSRAGSAASQRPKETQAVEPTARNVPAGIMDATTTTTVLKSTTVPEPTADTGISAVGAAVDKQGLPAANDTHVAQAPSPSPLPAKSPAGGGADALTVTPSDAGDDKDETTSTVAASSPDTVHSPSTPAAATTAPATPTATAQRTSHERTHERTSHERTSHERTSHDTTTVESVTTHPSSTLSSPLSPTSLTTAPTSPADNTEETSAPNVVDLGEESLNRESHAPEPQSAVTVDDPRLSKYSNEGLSGHSPLSAGPGVAASLSSSGPELNTSASSSVAKMRLFRSPKANGEATSPVEAAPSSPLGNSQRLRTASLTRAFRLRRTSNATPPASPPTRHAVQAFTSSSDGLLSNKEDGLKGLGIGLGNLLTGSGYRTASGGIGYTPPAKRSSPTTETPSASAALFSARQKELAEHNQALERWRRQEEERARQRSGSISAATTPVPATAAALPAAPPAQMIPAHLIGMNANELRKVVVEGDPKASAEERRGSSSAKGDSPRKYSTDSPRGSPKTDAEREERERRREARREERRKVIKGKEKEVERSREVSRELEVQKERHSGDSVVALKAAAAPPTSPSATATPTNGRASIGSSGHHTPRTPQERSPVVSNEQHDDPAQLVHGTRRVPALPRPASRVISMATSSIMGSEETGVGYDSTSDEMPHSLSIAFVSPPGIPSVISPVEQLTNAATAARAHRRNRSVASNADAETVRSDLSEGSERTTLLSPSSAADAQPSVISGFAGLVPAHKDLDGLEMLRRVGEADAKTSHSGPPSLGPVSAAPLSAALDAFSPIDPLHVAQIAVAEREREEAERAVREREEAERAEHEEADRKREQERIEAERLEKERREAERIERERAEKERQERERIQKEKQAAERRAAEQAAKEQEAKRSAAIREQLRAGKADGGIMLRGWVTVQTMTSLTWRRRYFHLLGDELRMYKSDVDAGKPPLVVVPLAGALVSETYEDSQVKGSWRLRDGKGEDLLMFADTKEDKDMILEGLGIAIG